MAFTNFYHNGEDDGIRAGLLYSLHRAWGEMTRQAASTRVPVSIKLDLVEMEEKQFAVAWLGHASLLLSVGERWILIDPVFGKTAGPLTGIGPKRLTRLPVALDALPHIDLVLISHDHFDHLQLEEMRQLARQPGGPPTYFVGSGLGPWFVENVGVLATEFAWWQSTREYDVELIFVPAQHSSGRHLFGKDKTLWGGWAVRYRGNCFYFAGDTAYVDGLFEDIHRRLGTIDVAAIPIGAYEPRDLMRFEHMNPTDAVKAHQLLDSHQSFGVHWGSFQLGDELPMAASEELLVASHQSNTHNFGVVVIGAVIDVTLAERCPRGSLEPPITTTVPSVPASR